MKKITVLLLTLFSLAAMAAQADDYIPLVEQGKVWKYAGYIEEWYYKDGSTHAKRMFLPLEVRIEGTKEIEGKEYAACQVYFEEKAVPAPNSPNFFLREDINDRKVWVRYDYENRGVAYIGNSNPNRFGYLWIGPEYWDIGREAFLIYDFSESPDYSFWNMFFYPPVEKFRYLEGIGVVSNCEHESHDAFDLYKNADEATFIAGANIWLSICETCIEGPIPLLYEVDDKEGNVLYYDDRFASLPGKIMDSNGLEKIVADDSPAVYYDLQGYKVDSPEPGQTVIRVRGSHADKIVIK